MSSTKKLLSTTNLKKYFPIPKKSIFQREQLYIRANEEITIDIHSGETFGLVGESGCGKSTLGRTILQLYPQTAGSTLYYGRTLEEIAPSYVARTLKNAPQMIAGYKKLFAKAETLVKACETAGENATFYQHQQKNLAVAEAETAFRNVVSILGGFAALDDCREGAKALLDRFTTAARISRLKQRMRDLDGEVAFCEASANEIRADGSIKRAEAKIRKAAARAGALTEKKQRLRPELDKLEAILRDDTARLESLRSRYAGNEDFARYEAMLDPGIDLSRLKYKEMRILRKDIQIIFQDPYSSLNPRMTVGQIIGEGLVTHGVFKPGDPQMKAYILDVMNQCGLQDHMLHRYPHQFSGGQRQRISIARALAVKPKFIVCDECVSALDVSIQSQIINLLEELKEKEHLTYLFISHDLSVVRHISDRIGVMYLGNLVELGRAEEVFGDPRHPYTVALLSSIPTTDAQSLKKERIILEGNIPSPIKPPEGCKFHTRCYMAQDKCRRVPPELLEITPGHYAACHFPEKKLDDNGGHLFRFPGKQGGE